MPVDREDNAWRQLFASKYRRWKVKICERHPILQLADLSRLHYHRGSNSGAELPETGRRC
jgi:hypothetical protein